MSPLGFEMAGRSPMQPGCALLPPAGLVGGLRWVPLPREENFGNDF